MVAPFSGLRGGIHHADEVMRWHNVDLRVTWLVLGDRYVDEADLPGWRESCRWFEPAR